jgi:hypothetical protein
MFDTFDRTGNSEFPFPKQVVFRALRDAVGGFRGMKVENCDELACRLDITTGMSAFSWGEKVSVSVAGNGDQAAVVSVQSAAKTIFGSGTTHGKNRKNIREILSRTSALLQENGGKWRKEMGLAPASVSVADELVKLAQLRDQGILNESEFQQQKAQLLRR